MANLTIEGTPEEIREILSSDVNWIYTNLAKFTIEGTPEEIRESLSSIIHNNTINMDESNNNQDPTECSDDEYESNARYEIVFAEMPGYSLKLNSFDGIVNGIEQIEEQLEFKDYTVIDLVTKKDITNVIKTIREIF